MPLLFTYGTLKRGHGNHRILENAKFLGEAKTKEKYVLMDFGGFPGMYNTWHKGMEPTTVTGELFEIDDAMLARCDRLEGHPTFYKRAVTTVVVDGKKAECLTYFYQGGIHCTQCINGKWR